MHIRTIEPTLSVASSAKLTKCNKDELALRFNKTFTIEVLAEFKIAASSN